MPPHAHVAHGPLVAAPVSEAFWKIQGAALVLFAASSFFPPLYHWQEYGLYGFLALAVGMALIGMRVSPWVRTPLDVPLLCFVGWVLCTVPFAVDVGYSVAEWRKFVAHVVVFYWTLLVYRANRSDELARRVLTAVAVGSLLLSLYAISDFLLRGGTWRDRLVRANAPGSDYNWLSTYMVLSVPVIAGLLMTERRPVFRLGAAVTVAASVLAQVASYGRAGWLGHAAQVLTLGFLSKRRRHMVLVSALLGAGLMSLLLLSRAGFQADTVNQWTLQTRMTVWKLGLTDIAQHPLVGIGYGNNTFIKRHPEYAPTVQDHFRERDRVPPSMHSAFLMVTLGSGIPALICFCWIFVRLLRLLLSRWSGAAGTSNRLLALCIGLAVIGFAVRNLFDYMFMGSLSHLFWILAATGLVLHNPRLVQPAAAPHGTPYGGPR